MGSATARRGASLRPRTLRAPSYPTTRNNQLSERNDSNVQNKPYGNETFHIVTSSSPARSSRRPAGVPEHDTTLCEADGDYESQIKLDSKNNAKVIPRSHVEVGSVLNEEDIVEVSCLNDATSSTLDGDLESQIKSVNQNDTKDRRRSIVDIGSVLNDEDNLEASSVDNATPCQPNGDLEKQIKLEIKINTKARRRSLVIIGSVLNDDDILELGSP